MDGHPLASPSERGGQHIEGIPLPLPLGEVAERSEDGEGRWQIDLTIQKKGHTAFPLSVTLR